MPVLEIAGAAIGLIYLYFEYKADKWLWFFGVLMPLIYIKVFFESKFYADMGINIYYLFAGIYGWIKWTRGGKNSDNGMPISHTPAGKILPLTAAATLLFGTIAAILVNFTDSPVPYGDSLTTALSIIGMWMLANKYIEQWGVWFAVNIISCGLYFRKGLNYTGALFLIYAVISVAGYFKWRKLMRSQEND